MRKAWRVVRWLLGVLVLLPIAVVAVALVLLNVDPGRQLVERQISQLTGDQVAITGLAGRFPDALLVGHAELRDARGAWLILDGLALDWSPLALLRGEARVDRLAAERVQMPRLPAPSAPSMPSPASDQPLSLPVRVAVEALHIARAEIGAPVAGVAAVLSLDGRAHLSALDDGDVDATLTRLDSPGSYEVHGAIDPAHLSAKLNLKEPAGGLLGTLAGVPMIGAIAAQANIDGPRAGEAISLQVSAGPLRASATGTIDLQNQAADLDVTAAAPAMNPAPGISWQRVALNAHLHGPFTAPDATGTLRATQLEAGGASIASLSADLSGNQGAAQLHATAEGLQIPGPKPGLLAAAPLALDASVRLDNADRPVEFSVSHPLLQIKGHANTGGALAGHADITVPNLEPLAAAGGVDLEGHTELAIDATTAGAGTTITADGIVAVTGGQAPAPALLGDAAKIGVTVTLDGGVITLARAQLDGRSLTLKASGADTNDDLDVNYKLGLSRLADLAATLDGAVTIEGTAKGHADNLAVAAKLTGDVGGKGIRSGPLTVSIDAIGLPGKPAGIVNAEGALDGSPINLAIHADRDPAGALHATIDRADWKSLHAEAVVTLANGATLPDGRVSLSMTKLEELRPLVGQAVSGSITASATLQGDIAKIDLQATRAGVPSASVGRAVLSARVTDRSSNPVVAATLDADGLNSGGIGGSVKFAVNGPQSALAMKLNAALTNVAGADATIASTATLNATGKVLQLATLTADWKAQTLRLLAPARIAFADGVAVDRLRVGLQQAVLDVAGRLSPALNVTASLHGVTPDLAKPFAPTIDATGMIDAEAKVTGTPETPQGSVKLTATGLRMRTGPAHGLPAANLTANAQLAGQSANVELRLLAGTANISVTGKAPLGAGPLGLHATGALDLALLEPVLAPAGRRATGRVALDAAISGTTAAPLANGTLNLINAEIQDFAQGIAITGVNGAIQASGDTVRIASLTAHAGPGTIAATGSVGLQGAMPVDLALTMRNARPLASDRLTATLNADLTLRGDLGATLAAAGKISIQRATINIPEHLPSSIAVLPIRIAGAPPLPPAKPGPVVRLDLALDTPGQIFVRGRGLDAVLGGSLRIAGTTVAPQVTGAFTMRNGTFSLAGTTLTFSRGKVSFEGAGVTDKIDPSLDFEADSATTTGTAMLIVGGFASAPKITLSASPPLPQDEVLAQLLFGRSAKELGPFQYAEIAAALADLSGTTSGASNPLNGVRKGLGLDRLSVGGGTAGSSGGSSAATIEAGKYVANGIYVGAKQGTTGAQTQAVVQIDIYKGLKIETNVGTGAGGSSVGLTYQFEY